jgi:hypothetical protein
VPDLFPLNLTPDSQADKIHYSYLMLSRCLSSLLGENVSPILQIIQTRVHFKYKEYTVFEMGLESRLGDMSTYRVLFE